jgi:hypothetical protein
MTQMNKFENLNDRFASLGTGWHNSESLGTAGLLFLLILVYIFCRYTILSQLNVCLPVWRLYKQALLISILEPNNFVYSSGMFACPRGKLV